MWILKQGKWESTGSPRLSRPCSGQWRGPPPGCSGPGSSSTGRSGSSACSHNSETGCNNRQQQHVTTTASYTTASQEKGGTVKEEGFLFGSQPKKVWRKQEQIGNTEFSSVSQQQQQQSLYWPLIVNMFLWSIRLWANGGSPTHKITPPNSHLKLLLPTIKENLYKIFTNNIEMKEMWKPWGRIP